MRLDFKRLEMHSFMSFEDETFDFDRHKGMTLVRGRNDDLPGGETNGAGKSNVFLALLYALFGQTYSKMKNENVVNKYVADKDMRLSLTFDVDGEPWHVVRGLNRGRTSYMELYRGDADATKSTIAETQSFLEKDVMGCDLQVFLRTVLLTSRQTYNFYELKKSEKKEFVERLFDIAVFGDMYQAIHRDLLDSDRAILALQNKLMVLNKAAGDYEERAARHEKEKAERLARLDESISAGRKAFEERRSKEVERHDEEAAKIEDAVEKARKAKAGYEREAADAAAEASKADVAIHKLAVSRDGKRAELDKYAGIMSKLCDDCWTVFREHYGIASYEDDIKKLEEKSAELAGRKAAAAERKAAAEEKSRTLDGRIEKAEAKARELTAEYDRARRELARLEASVAASEAERARAEREPNPYTDLMESNRKAVAEETAALDKAAERHSYLKAAEGVVSQDTLRKFIISDLIGLLNNKIKTYLTKLGSRYTVVFDSDMDYEFVTEGGTYEFGNFSAGEATRIMIATSLAFRDFMSVRNGLVANILVLDEYFDSAISAACVERILGILKDYVRDYGQNVYCISHRAEVSVENFSEVVEVRKSGNISRITYQA